MSCEAFYLLLRKLYLLLRKRYLLLRRRYLLLPPVYPPEVRSYGARRTAVDEG